MKIDHLSPAESFVLLRCAECDACRLAAREPEDGGRREVFVYCASCVASFSWGLENFYFSDARPVPPLTGLERVIFRRVSKGLNPWDRGESRVVSQAVERLRRKGYIRAEPKFPIVPSEYGAAFAREAFG